MGVASFYEAMSDADAETYLRNKLEQYDRIGKLYREINSERLSAQQEMAVLKAARPATWHILFPPTRWENRPPPCGCGSCTDAREATMDLEERLMSRRLIVCPNCGNKRCPQAAHHEFECTNSNEPGQIGTKRSAN